VEGFEGSALRLWMGMVLGLGSMEYNVQYLWLAVHNIPRIGMQQTKKDGRVLDMITINPA
jgi:hypothetical protein